MKILKITPKFVDCMPENLTEGVLYISEKYHCVIHLCACGCKLETVTDINTPEGWIFTNNNGLVTLDPSIGNFQFFCKSHYYIRNNEIVWC